jgi:hypothetical protein
MKLEVLDAQGKVLRQAGTAECTVHDGSSQTTRPALGRQPRLMSGTPPGASQQSPARTCLESVEQPGPLVGLRRSFVSCPLL